ncbi:hypothetical protein BV98_001027 [Sphingobium herbicidovorans NBRC 16415]|uniref:DUF2849 domain-containing protein n=1 Tax=Sphingobium herbicidovorans (strain ATCC 700291 / DSM 11019 / CCUG 56400 / KCTC 2939 / LMG 18315 / NBRC 16415 / MH) TaxID=1219045 RepID=A0A086PCZ9_SPHHM|nr:DUF2849 domain-containing protein [Sphingobium herbicidovorans]KFG91267.1 hypothetical protein BV98_001027 [Sphingobium herbicidovorans NBRC 16415]
MKILTGNDLGTGDVIWWAGDGWSRLVGDSVDVGDRGDELARAEEAALRVVGAYVIDATVTEDGVRPAHIKDRIRALGPTVRPDLTLKPNDADAGNWVI